MAEVSALFWDVGGVLLTDGWDERSRRKAACEFDLDWGDFENRHDMVATAFEVGRIGLDRYLKTTVFHEPRPFEADAFKAFMFEQSNPHPEALALAERLARSKKYLMSTINNESLELNVFRIRRFGLRDCFTAFFSSCFLGVKKPDEAIFRIALQVTERDGGDSLFIDDREQNFECARACGMQAIHFRGAAQLQSELEALGVEIRAEA